MKEKNQQWIYRWVLILIIIFSCSFIAFMGYLNFKVNHKEIQNQIYREIAGESVDVIENAIKFGKSLENYYGMDRIFYNIKELIGEEIELLVTDADQGVIYYSFDRTDPIFDQVTASLSGKNSGQAADNIKAGEKSQTYTASGWNYMIQPIWNQAEISGLFWVIYKDEFIGRQLTEVRFTIFIHTITAMAIALALFIPASIEPNTGMFFNRYQLAVGCFTPGSRHKKRFITLFPILLIMVTILIQSAFSILVYRDSYKNSMMDGGKLILSNLNETISHVLASGAELEDVDGIAEYLVEKVEKIPILRNIRIVNEIAGAAGYTGGDNELLLQYDLYGETLKLSSELSSEYINDKIMQVVLLMVSTLIIIIIFIAEIIKIPWLILYCSSDKQNTECEESYKQVGSSLRLTSFLCSTAEYICVPYAAMMIRDMNGSVFGLSVGMTAALPLSVACLAQMAGMLILPKLIKRINIKTTLILSGLLMAACNVMAFSANDAMTIIVCRGLAGIAYAGFKQVTNYLITRGYQTEQQRSINLSQDNAGLLGGITCGAGLGAVISSTAGYPATFLIAILVFFIYVSVSLYIIPWKWLKDISKEDGIKEKLSFKKVWHMIFSWETMGYIISICIPLNIAIMLIVTLIPGICQYNSLSTLVLSYCYIVNGIAGIYIGPALVNRSRSRWGLKKSMGFALAVTGASIYILELPPLAVMLIASSLVLGFIDGFSTPLAIDRFLELKVVKQTVNESAALILYAVLSYVFTAIAPMAAEFMLMETNTSITPLLIVAIVYSIAAVFLLMPGKRKKAALAIKPPGKETF